MKNAVWYKTCWLMKTSKAYELYEEAKKSGDYKTLDRHLKQINAEAHALLTRYDKATVPN
jgi:hypothetical protein